MRINPNFLDIGIFESQIGMNLLPLSADSESDECLTDEETQNCSESEENEIY